MTLVQFKSTWNIFQTFLKEHDVLRDQLHKLLFDLVPLVTKRLSSSMFTGGFLCLFTAKQLKIGDRSILNLQFCLCTVIPSELYPGYTGLINTSLAFLGQPQSVQPHLAGAAPQCSAWWGGRALIASMPFQLECCRVCGWEMQCMIGQVSVAPPRPCWRGRKEG